MLIEWNNALCVGMPAIDEQHRAMAALLEELETALHDSAPEPVVHFLLDRLYDHTRVHFGFEEKAMAQMDFAGAVEHRREHVMLLAELKSFIAGVRKGQERLDSAALEELKRWLVGHILGSDRTFAAAALEAGLTL